MAGGFDGDTYTTATRSPFSDRRRETHRATLFHPITWNTQRDQSAELPPRLSAWNRAAGTEPGPGRRCVRAQLFVQRGNRAQGSFSAGLVLLSAAEGAPAGHSHWHRPRNLPYQMDQICRAQHAGKEAGFHGSACIVKQLSPRGVADVGFVLVRTCHICCQSAHPK